MGIKTDAHLTAHQYSWLGSIYYLGYLVAVYPHNRLFQRLNQTKYLAVCAFLWGAILCCMAACNNFTGLMLVRGTSKTNRIGLGFRHTDRHLYSLHGYFRGKRLGWVPSHHCQVVQEERTCLSCVLVGCRSGCGRWLRCPSGFRLLSRFPEVHDCHLRLEDLRSRHWWCYCRLRRVDVLLHAQ